MQKRIAKVAVAGGDLDDLYIFRLSFTYFHFLAMQIP